MLFLRVSYLEIVIVLVVVLLTFSPYFLNRDVQRVRSKVQLLEHTMVSQKPVVLLLLAANVVLLFLILYFWIF